MMRRTIPLTVAVLALVFVQITGAGASMVERPFRATLHGDTTSVVFAPGPPGSTSTFGGRCSVPSNWLISFAGWGKATHLGRLTWTSSHCTQVGADPPFSVTMSDGEFTYVTANGDTLVGGYGNSRITVLTSTSMCIDDDATFSGGTGRFAHVTGSAVEHACFDPNDPDLPSVPIHLTSSGSLSYDASDRAG